jgi:hypothetical protein
MTNEITLEILDRVIAHCEQNAFWGKGSAIQRMQDFYYEQTRDTVTEDWSQGPTKEEIEQRLGVASVSYRIYYSKDNLTRRVFIFRPHCTPDEMKKMLDMGFVVADVENGDANIPDKPVQEVEE